MKVKMNRDKKTASCSPGVRFDILQPLCNPIPSHLFFPDVCLEQWVNFRAIYQSVLQKLPADPPVKREFSEGMFSNKSRESKNGGAPPASEITRRDFMALAVAAGVGIGAGGAVSPALAADTRGGIPYRTLGRTGEKISAIGLGGAHLGGKPSEEESLRIIRTALDGGVNFLDNSWDYHHGASEIRMGKALRDGYREKAFLMTKFDGRNKTTAAQQIDESLRRLQTEYVDLLQVHEVIRMNDPDRVFAPGGAIEAIEEARKAGKCRYVGFTGHKSPEIHLKMLALATRNGFRFDTVQMPLNVMDAHFESFAVKVLPELITAEIGVLGMKPIGGGEILRSATVTPVECLRYALNLPVSVVITGCDSLPILQQAMETARAFHPMDREEMAALLAKTAPAARDGKYELYKNSTHFDSTAQNPEYLG